MCRLVVAIQPFGVLHHIVVNVNKQCSGTNGRLSLIQMEELLKTRRLERKPDVTTGGKSMETEGRCTSSCGKLLSRSTKQVSGKNASRVSDAPACMIGKEDAAELKP